MKYGSPVREPAREKKPKVELSDEKRKELLEKMRERRRKALGENKQQN